MQALHEFFAIHPVHVFPKKSKHAQAQAKGFFRLVEGQWIFDTDTRHEAGIARTARLLQPGFDGELMKCGDVFFFVKQAAIDELALGKKLRHRVPEFIFIGMQYDHWRENADDGDSHNQK
ncbi:MAG: hypothetical protein IKC51_03430 [Myxococcaceae bacterium]|nr:hypothetical protein [Myxococcaceae bacterium]